MGNFETDVQIQGEFSPFERVILTANGNLQRIMSAYYGAPVHVKINKCVRVDSQIFDREVDLHVGEYAFCRAMGKVIGLVSALCFRNFIFKGRLKFIPRSV